MEISALAEQAKQPAGSSHIDVRVIEPAFLIQKSKDGTQMKIKVSQISNREHDVKTSNKNMERMFDLQLLMAQADDLADKEPIEIIKIQRNMLHDSIDFLVTVLGLNKQEQDKLNEMEFKQTVECVNYVFERMMGLSDEDIDLANKKRDASKSKD
ncbi:phage tail assembly chaperone [Schleiferilactobacillus harbinensis]|uniref:phage tail assembly chaperone n=1 Tax=Schleiferilactobacillus harbinensis TaxID=304207 RepID=UPI00116F6CD7|nr:phage tail assembly chaperone [Schleiferilactobacillus harbinensis]GEK06655.1 hypothetical protein LHA01_18940 [Schleiferilactobacillus harbinensis]